MEYLSFKSFLNKEMNVLIERSPNFKKNQT